MLGRRGFLKLFGAGVVGLAIALKAPERSAVVEIPLAEQFGVDFEWTHVEAAMMLEEPYASRYRETARQWAEHYDGRAAELSYGRRLRDWYASAPTVQIRTPKAWRA